MSKNNILPLLSLSLFFSFKKIRGKGIDIYFLFFSSGF